MAYIDKQKILEELGGLPEEIYDELCQGFLEDAKSKMILLKIAVDETDYEKMKSFAHSLKGAAANLRLLDIQEAAYQFEDAAKMTVMEEELLRLFNVLDQAIKKFKF